MRGRGGAGLETRQRRAVERGRQPRARAGDAVVRAGGGRAAAGAHLAVGGRGTWGVGRLRGGAARTPRWRATARRLDQPHRDRKSVVVGKSVSVRVARGGRRSSKKQQHKNMKKSVRDVKTERIKKI